MRLAIIILAFFITSPAWAAIASVGTILNCGHITPGTTFDCTTTAQLDINNVMVLELAADNICDTNAGSVANTIEHTAIGISGNMFTKIAEKCHEVDDPGFAGSGATISLWVYRATANIASGATVTFTLANSTTAKSAIGWEFTVTSGNTLQLAGAVQAEKHDGADSGSLQISGLSNIERLYWRAMALERDTGGTFTETADFTSIGVANADTGVPQDSMEARGEFRILTDTGSTSDPTLGSAVDGVDLFAALEEVLAPTRRPFGVVIFQ